MFKKWFDKFPLRLSAEKIIMAQTHPQFVLKKDRKGQIFWEGYLQTNFGTLYLVNILYPANYPWDKPKLQIVDPPVRHDAPHRFVDGSLCAYPDDWGPKRCTAPAAVPLIAAWLALYEVFLRTGERW
jgi:ubiquitin-protein ligase